MGKPVEMVGLAALGARSEECDRWRDPCLFPLTAAGFEQRGSTMSKGRLEAFTDGVIAIIITIMVLEMKVPEGSGFAALESSLPVFMAYVLSYVNVGLVWNNHHHMLHATERVNGAVLWANLFLLFWLSLVPFVIRWMDQATFFSYWVAASSTGVRFFLSLFRVMKRNAS